MYHVRHEALDRRQPHGDARQPDDDNTNNDNNTNTNNTTTNNNANNTYTKSR